MTTAFAGLLPTVGLHFGMGLRGIPLTLGLGFHQELIANQTWSSSETGVFAYGGNVGFGTLHLSRRLEARHFDVVLRLEPEWRRFRPYLELLGGTSQIFCVSTLSATLGSNLYSQEDTGGLTWSYGYGAGIRFEPFHPMVVSRGSLALVVTVGARRMFAGPLTYLEPRGTVVGGVQSTTISIKEANFDVIEPYLLIGLESRSP